eukprot:COSAG01_NODE_8348_length_2820_cov_32.756340_2_plen_545_part_00
MSASDLEYFQKHGVEANLSEVITQVAKLKPADPYKFIADAMTKLSLSGAAATAPAAPAAALATKKEPAPAPVPRSKAAKGQGKASNTPSKGGGVEVRKADDLPVWYEQVIKKAELIEPYPVKGCFTLRPWAYGIWEAIQRWFDHEIKLMGVENAYFPLFVPKSYLQKEEDHLDDFAPEVAWVTKSGDKDLEEPVAIRPTSETVMYAAYANWVQSHRDLPIKVNQWCNVVRWEVKQTTPFLRTREFLWQEGHTAYPEYDSAAKEVLEILELYAGVYEKLLACPVVRGTKTKAETFPGADYTTTVEAFIPANGRAIQGATSHHLGQNFSKMFDISFQDPKDASGQTKVHAFQNSWGLTTRTIGVMIMVHGDDRGLVLPPAVAMYQVVIVPVGLKKTTPEADRLKVEATGKEYMQKLQDAGVRVKLDAGDNSPGWKFNHWEMKGVPLRIELGPMDVNKGEFVMAKRNVEPTRGSKITGKDASVVQEVRKALDDVQSELFEKATAVRDANLATVDEWKDVSPTLGQGKLVLAFKWIWSQVAFETHTFD